MQIREVADRDPDWVNLHCVWVLILSEDNISSEIDSLNEHYNFIDSQINEFIQ